MNHIPVDSHVTLLTPRGSHGHAALRLRAGETLDVEVHETAQGGRGILLNGTFIPASIPEHLENGTPLTVLVAPQLDTLVLRILHQSAPQETGASLLDVLLRGLGIATDSNALRSLARWSPFVPQQLLTSESLWNEQLPSSSTEPSYPQTDLRAQLPPGLLIASERELAQPSQLRSLLTFAFRPGLFRALEEAVDALRDLRTVSERLPSSGGASKLELTALQPLTHRLQQIADAAKVPLHELLSVPLLRTLIEQHASPSSRLIGAGTQQVKSSPDLFEQLLRALLQHLDEAPNAPTPQGGERAAKGSPPPQIPTMTRAEQGHPAGGTSGGNTPQLTRTMPSLEELARGQELLRSLAPLLQAAGEPTVTLLPLHIGAVLSTLELRIDPPPVHEEEQESANQGRTRLRSVHLALSLPTLGALEVDIAYSESELLARIVGEEPRVVAQLEARLEQLERRLNDCGFTHVRLRAVAGTPQRAAPGWYPLSTTRSVVA